VIKRYLDTVELLIQAAPLVFADERMALKGGTAINLFVRDMPRLSLDLDLVLVDRALGRDQALASIGAQLRDARDRLLGARFQARVVATRGGDEARLQVRRGDLEVKIEINHVMRGTLLPVRPRRMAAAARRTLRADLTLPLLHEDELYGSKLVAALDRQHPRDLFDVVQLYAHGGITPGMRRCFVVYLACHNRPTHEVLFASEKDIRLAYESQFSGMTAEETPLDQLLDVRARLLRELPASLDEAERAFLRSLVRAEPDFDLLGIPHLGDLPALRWKVENLRKLASNNPAKLRAQADALDERLGALP
jgi:hypothetical protein